MSTKEIATKVTTNPLFPIASGAVLALFGFLLTRSAAATDELKREMSEKASTKYVEERLIETKKEIDARRDADFREIMTNIQYIKEGVDELKRK